WWLPAPMSWSRLCRRSGCRRCRQHRHCGHTFGANRVARRRGRPVENSTVPLRPRPRGSWIMAFRILIVALGAIGLALPAVAGERSWQGKTILITRAGVKLQAPEGAKIAPKTAGAARDVTFQILKDEDGRLLID